MALLAIRSISFNSYLFYWKIWFGSQLKNLKIAYNSKKFLGEYQLLLILTYILVKNETISCASRNMETSLEAEWRVTDLIFLHTCLEHSLHDSVYVSW